MQEGGVGAFFGHSGLLLSKGAVQQLVLGILAVYGAGVRSGSDSDLGERRAGVRFYLKSGPDRAQPIRLISTDSGVA